MFTIDATTGYTAPAQNVRVSNKIGQTTDYSFQIRVAAFALFIIAGCAAYCGGF